MTAQYSLGGLRSYLNNAVKHIIYYKKSTSSSSMSIRFWQMLFCTVVLDSVKKSHPGCVVWKRKIEKTKYYKNGSTV